MFSSFHRRPSAAPPFARSEHYTRKDRPHAPAWRASEPVTGAAGGGRGRWPGGPGERFDGRLPNPYPVAPFAAPPRPRLARTGLRSHLPPPSSPAPLAQPGPRNPCPAPPPAATRPPAFPARPAPTFTCTFCTQAARRATNTSPGPLPPPPRLRPASSFPSKAAK